MWKYNSVKLQLNKAELRVLEYMVDVYDPKPRFRSWTEAQVIARCRNMAQQQQRRTAHATGAE